jgi:hypothetical protein
MPKEDVPVRAAAAILSKVAILAVNSDEPLLFQFVDVPAGLGFTESDLCPERWDPGKCFPVLASITAKATVNHLGTE